MGPTERPPSGLFPVRAAFRPPAGPLPGSWSLWRLLRVTPLCLQLSGQCRHHSHTHRTTSRHCQVCQQRHLAVTATVGHVQFAILDATLSWLCTLLSGAEACPLKKALPSWPASVPFSGSRTWKVPWVHLLQDLVEAAWDQPPPRAHLPTHAPPASGGPTGGPAFQACVC